MAFTYEVVGKTVFGNKRVEYGYFESTDSDTGGTIDTDLRYIEYINLTPFASSTGTIETLSIDDGFEPEEGDFDVITEANGAGFYMVIGL